MADDVFEGERRAIERLLERDLASIAERTRGYTAGSRAESTRRAYAKDWEQFVGWCGSHGLVPLPASPATVAMYASDLAQESKVSTISRKLAALSVVHKAAGHGSPASSELVRSTMAGIRRAVGVAQSRKAPVRASHLRGAAGWFPDDAQGIRDRALLLIGYAGGFRRSELVALDLEDVEFVPDGVVLTVRRSKTDQEGEGLKKAIVYGRHEATCPVRALKAWLSAAEITEGPLFRRVGKWREVRNARLSPQSVALVVKRWAPLLGLDPEHLGAHSLRSGLVTDGFAEGVQEVDIMRQTGHRSRAVLEGYYRETNLFKQNVTAKVGL